MAQDYFVNEYRNQLVALQNMYVGYDAKYAGGIAGLIPKKDSAEISEPKPNKAILLLEEGL